MPITDLQSRFACWLGAGISFLCLFPLVLWAGDRTTRPTLTEARQILDLSSTTPYPKHPVRLRAVVTCHDPATELFFVQDATAGIFIYDTNSRPRLVPGTLVQIDGASGAGLFSPIVIPDSIQIIGPGQLPGPKPIGIEQLATGSADGQWVEVEGMVQNAGEDWGHLLIELVNGSSRLFCRVIEYPADAPHRFIGARVRIQGVVGSFYNRKRQLTGFHLLVPRLSEVTIIESGLADPFMAEVTSCRSVMSYSTRARSDARVRVQGVVTLAFPGQSIYIADHTSGLHVQIKQTVPFPVGAKVDVVGFPARGDFGPVLRHGICRVIGSGEARAPVKIKAAQALNGDYDSELVQVSGELVQTVSELDGQMTLVLRQDQEIFGCLLHPAIATAGKPRWREGSRLQLTGICRVQKLYDDAKKNKFVVLLRSPSDVVLLRQPPLWLAGRILMAAAGLVIAGLVWIAVQRHRMRVRSEAIHQREAMLEQRERLGRDLHDGIIQSIYAIGLNLEHCRQRLPGDQGEPARALNLARAALNNVIRDIRTFIARLEAKPIPQQDLKAALESLVATIGSSQSAKVILSIDPDAAARLTDSQADHLLNITREAISNSIRHAHAKETKITLQDSKGAVLFEVSDDGVGFDPNLLNGDGHGIRNITARARELGASLEIDSNPGRGTQIRLALKTRSCS